MARHVTALLVAAPTEDPTASVYLSTHRGKTVIEQALETSSTWPVDDRILVLGSDAEAILGQIETDVDVVIDPEWEEGIAASLRVGFDVVTRADRSGSILVAMLDRRLVSGDVVAAILEAAERTDRPIVAAKYRYAVDHPYLVDVSLWPRFLGLEGNVSLESVVATHPEWLEAVWFDRLPPQRFRTMDDLPADG